MESLKTLINRFDLVVNYYPSLYKYLREKGEIKKATGIERERIIKQAKGDLNECKRIQMEEYFAQALKKQKNDR